MFGHQANVRSRTGRLSVVVIMIAAVLSAMVSAAGAVPKDEKDLCKDGGWRQYGFRNQGQCIAFVNHGGHLRRDTTLSITKSGPPGAFPNQNFAFVMTVRNTGQNTASGARIVDTLPAQGSFVSSNPSGTPASPAPGSTYTIPLGDIAPGGTATATVTWKAPVAGDSVVHNSATASAANAPTTSPATADVPVGIATRCNPCGSAAAGTGLRNRDSGTISIAGIPQGATVGRAVLVWSILYSGSPPANTITFQGHRIVADVSQTISGNLCWGDTATIGYAADVTSFVAGNGSYVVSDPPRGVTRPDSDPAGTLPYTDGASLVVFYIGGGANNQVLSDFTYNTDTDASHSIHRSFTGIHSVGGPSSLTLAGPDGQNNGSETFTITGSGSIQLNNTWDGSDPQSGPQFAIGNLWDTDLYGVTSVLPAGQTSLQFDHSLTGDCIGVGAAVLQVSQSPSAPAAA